MRSGLDAARAKTPSSGSDKKPQGSFAKPIAVVCGHCQKTPSPHQAGDGTCFNFRGSAPLRSQALVLQSAADLKRAKRWSYITLYAKKVQGDPFWKAVRPDGVPRAAMLRPDIVTSRFYTTCFTGVVVPFVCTTGSAVCGQ
jgi:hypothetical protein